MLDVNNYKTNLKLLCFSSLTSVVVVAACVLHAVGHVKASQSSWLRCCSSLRPSAFVPGGLVVTKE